MNMPLDKFREWHSFAFTFCTGTEDHREGARAFVEKREPKFKGK
ncbi:MAG: hypothetical protein PHN78_09380 [Dehalococcoidales bacterium]|nr:hypothetical protein [Dehalococcoidales bacterium]